MRDGRLIEVEARGEIADADLVLAASKRRENRDTRWIGEGLKEARFVGQIAVVHRRFGAAALNRHTSILLLNRKMPIHRYTTRRRRGKPRPRRRCERRNYQLPLSRIADRSLDAHDLSASDGYGRE